jgi:hypothetical protein
MPREDEHKIKAERNEQFAESLPSDPIAENWAVVATFYSALHYVEVYFAKYNIEADSHGDRFDQIKADIKLRTAFNSYHYLYDLGRVARYRCKGLPDKPYAVAKPHLATVKRQVDHALKS